MKKYTKRSQSQTLVKLDLTLLSFTSLRLMSKSQSHRPYNKDKMNIFLYILVFIQRSRKKCDFVTLLITTLIIN